MEVAASYIVLLSSIWSFFIPPLHWFPVFEATLHGASPSQVALSPNFWTMPGDWLAVSYFFKGGSGRRGGGGKEIPTKRSIVLLGGGCEWNLPFYLRRILLVTTYCSTQCCNFSHLNEEILLGCYAWSLRTIETGTVWENFPLLFIKSPQEFWETRKLFSFFCCTSLARWWF